MAERVWGLYAASDVTMGTGAVGVPCGAVGMPVLLPGTDGAPLDKFVPLNNDFLVDPLPAAVAEVLLGAGADDGLPLGLHTFVDAMAMPGVTKLRVTALLVLHVRGWTMPADPGPDADDVALPVETMDGDPAVDLACSLLSVDGKHLCGAAGPAIGLVWHLGVVAPLVRVVVRVNAGTACHSGL